jgi:hypothetical protein
LVLHKFVDVVNVVFNKLISLPMSAEMCSVLNDFKLWCGLPNVQGAVDGTHLFISKPFMPFLEYYYYFKFGGYSIVIKVVVDCKKRFTDICVGMLGSVNDSCVFA